MQKVGLNIFLCLMMLYSNTSFGQTKDAIRSAINQKRYGIELTDNNALILGKDFQKQDSTYYVGYLMEGYYKYNHSADYFGYKNAIESLERAKYLLEKDYDPVLKNLFSSLDYLTTNYNLFQDYYSICNALKDCYDNIEMPDSVMNLLDHIGSYHFKKDFFGIYYHKAWTFHRNRILTSSDYPFLKNSVYENEMMAFKYCYEGLAFVKENKAVNDVWFGENQGLADDLQIYHYLALLHCYNKNYDSSFYYYNILAKYGMISWNNYAGFQTEVGNFRNAQTFFNKDLTINYNGENVLKEPYYYLPELYIYAGESKKAIELCNQIIHQNGSRPGFGWYNIALARSFIYNGQLDSASIVLTKASEFKELHIGTTLTQEQYNFTIHLLQVNILDRQIMQLKFLHINWWYSPTQLYQLSILKIKKLQTEYRVCMELAFNPDRFRMVYDLFSSEATTTFDEAWYLMQDFSPKFFATKYKNYQTVDKRSNIQRYFQLFEAKFNFENGDISKAQQEVESMLTNTKLDTENEKLFLGRLYEIATKIYTSIKNKTDQAFYDNLLWETYPQLIPFSNINISLNLKTTGIQDDKTRQIIKNLKNVNIHWTNNNQNPTATINFQKRGDKYQSIINVVSANNVRIVDNSVLVFKNSDNVSQEIALRLFNKGGGIVFSSINQDAD